MAALLLGGNMKKENRFIKFSSAQQMYEYVSDGHDLYSKSLGVYLFSYNDRGALCYYYLSDEEAGELARQKEKGEYWGAYLGCGGYILDDEYGDQFYLDPSWNFCRQYFRIKDWMLTDEVTEKYCLE